MRIYQVNSYLRTVHRSSSCFVKPRTHDDSTICYYIANCDLDPKRLIRLQTQTLNDDGAAAVISALKYVAPLFPLERNCGITTEIKLGRYFELSLL